MLDRFLIFYLYIYLYLKIIIKIIEQNSYLFLLEVLYGIWMLFKI